MATRRSGYYKTTYSADLTLLDTPYRRGLLAVLVAGLLLLPPLAATHLVYTVNLAIIAIIGALALNILTGYAGQISLGHAALLAVGGFVSHYLSTFGLPFVLVVPLAMTAGALIGLVVGLPALLLRGLYLVLGTVGLHYLVVYAVNEYQTSGDSMLQMLTGLLLPTPNLGLVMLDSQTKWYYFLLLVLLVTTVYCINLTRTRPGRAWIAVRDRDIAAAALGINVARYKLLAFMVSSALTCMAGSLLVYFIGSVSAEYYTLGLAISYLAMVVIGGSGSVTGSYLGAIFVVFLPELITGMFQIVGADPRIQMRYVAPSQTIVFGLAMIFFLLFEPRGIVGIWHRIRAYFELWPLRQSMLAGQR